MPADDADRLGPCPLCGRDMIAGPSVDKHHWLPKSRGGTDAEHLHRVCHRMLHRVFDNAELATSYSTPQAALAHPDIAKFVKWVRKKPIDYVDWPKRSRR